MTEGEIKRRALVLAYKRTFASEDGQQVLADLWAMTLGRPLTYYTGPLEHDALVWNEARRSMVMAIANNVEKKLDSVERTQTVNEEKV